MTHPFRTLLFELFFEPILRLWQRVFGFGEAAGLQEDLKAFVLGHKPGRIRDSALNRLLQKVRSANFNAMQITAIHTSRFLGVPINSPASVERADRSKR